MQSRRASLTEAIANVTIGYIIAVLAAHTVLPWFGMVASVSDSAQIAAVFTAISLVRSYVVRRAFNWMTARVA